MPTLNRIALLLLISLCVAVGFWLRSGDAPDYRSLADLTAQQDALGFVVIGRFGSDWPATVVEIRESNDRIEFRRDNGQNHIYNGFDGYRLRMIRLHGRDNGESIVVFRSREKAGNAPPVPGGGEERPLVRRL